MAARILAINASEITDVDISYIKEHLSEGYCSLIETQSIESALHVIGTQSIDIVMLVLPKSPSDLFMEFCSVLRSSCGVIPIIGICKEAAYNPNLICQLELDDVIYSNIDMDELLWRIRVLRRNIFLDSRLVGHFKTDLSRRKAIVCFGDAEEMDNAYVSNADVLFVEDIESLSCIQQSIDLFVIAADHCNAFQYCSLIRLNDKYRYVPIILLYDDSNYVQVKTSMKRGVGCVEILHMHKDKARAAIRMNSLIKYKRLYMELADRVKQSMYMSSIDVSTGVYSRGFLENYSNRWLDQAGVSRFALLVVDLDKFKNINDKFGHKFGDSILCHIANTIKKNVRASDIVSRYGGDEFIIVMHNIDKNDAIRLADRIRVQIANLEHNGVSCTVSIGLCCGNRAQYESMHFAIREADELMYLAKNAGGNSVRFSH